MKIALCPSKRVLIFILGLFYSGCDVKTNHQPLYAEQNDCFTTLYRIRNTPLTSINSDWAINENVNHINEKLSVLCVFSYKTNEFKIVDLNSDEIIKIVKFPEKITKIGSISISDTNHFAFITDTTFYVFKNNNFERINYGVFNDEYYPLNYINIIYKSKENKLISGVLTYTKGKVGELPYSSFFLNIYDLNTMTSSLIPFSYPQQFHGGKLGIPKVNLSELNDDLLVSFELDDNVYKINLKTNQIDTILCKSKVSNINEAFYPTNGDKQAKMDALQKKDLYVGGYGMAFQNKNKIYRLYQPGLPVKDKDGNYFNSTDKGTHILELDLSNNSIKEIQLANGQYYVPQAWSFNRFNNCFIYPKLEEHATKKNVCFFNIHRISIYN